MKNERYEGWGKDTVKARLYLLEVCLLDENETYGFYFNDGTGFCGLVHEFIPYLISRFKWNPEDAFEIEGPLGNVPSGELYPPTEEGEVWQPGKQDPRF